jgi:hypothetical protein
MHTIGCRPQVLLALPAAQLKRTLKGLRRRGRLAAIDALVQRAAARGADGRALLEAALPFASDAALRQQWRGLEEGASALTWGLLANYHPGFCSERLQQSNRKRREARLAAAFPWLVVHDQEGALQLLQSLEPDRRSISKQIEGRWAAAERSGVAGKRTRMGPATTASGRRCRRAKYNMAHAAKFACTMLPLQCAVNRWGWLARQLGAVSGSGGSCCKARLCGHGGMRMSSGPLLPRRPAATRRGRRSCCWRRCWSCLTGWTPARCRAAWTTRAGRWRSPALRLSAQHVSPSSASTSWSSAPRRSSGGLLSRLQRD